MYLDKNEKVQDYKIKQYRLCVPFTITGHATPASKVVASDLAVMYVRTEGLTTVADAADDGGDFATADDGTGVFGILFVLGVTVRKVLRCSVEQRQGTTATNTDQLVALKGTSTTGVTADGNIAFDVTATGLDLSAENFNGVAIIEYTVE